MTNAPSAHRASYDRLCSDTLPRLLQELFPPRSTMEFVGLDLEESSRSEEECQLRGETYSYDVVGRFRAGGGQHVGRVAALPRLTERETLIVRGVERTPLMQLRLRPGLYFTVVEEPRRTRHVAMAVPSRGLWVRIVLDRVDGGWVARASFGEPASRSLLRQLRRLRLLPEAQERFAADDILGPMLRRRAGDETPPPEETPLLVAFGRVDLGHDGRRRFNERVAGLAAQHGLSPGEGGQLEQTDIWLMLHGLVASARGDEHPDSLSDLSHRRVLALGEHLDECLERARPQLHEAAQGRRRPLEVTLARVRGIIDEAFERYLRGSFCQLVDQTNPAAELAQRRRVSYLGRRAASAPGGRAEWGRRPLRGVDPSHYGRLCLIETPETDHIGLDLYLARYARVSDSGSIETPVRARAGEEVWVSAESERESRIAPAEAPDAGVVRVRHNGDVNCVRADEVTHRDVFKDQSLSYSASLVPFLEHNDLNRGMMGAKNLKQALPLRGAEIPLVASGSEEIVATQSGRRPVVTGASGEVTQVSTSVVTVRKTDGTEDRYPLQPLTPTPQRTFTGHVVRVKAGDRIEAGSVLADAAGTREGFVALGVNCLVAYMPWHGYNFEDAIVVSDRLVAEDVFTSYHMQELSFEVRGNEMPGLNRRGRDRTPPAGLEHLDEEGVVKVGTRVAPGVVVLRKWKVVRSSQIDEPRHEVTPERCRGTVVRVTRVPLAASFVIAKPGLEIDDPSQMREIVRIWVARDSRLSIGDKLTGRHGNKGVVGRIVERDKLPHLEDGTPVDVVLNPHGVISRMNLGQLFETHLGWVARRLGCRFEAPPFGQIALARCDDRAIADEVQRILAKGGDHLTIIDRLLELANARGGVQLVNGKARLLDGRKGTPFTAPVTVGVQYLLKLNHLAQSKLAARDEGGYLSVTRQPSRGDGGQRMGEMEVWALEAHNVSALLRETLTLRSDDVRGRPHLWTDTSAVLKLRTGILPSTLADADTDEGSVLATMTLAPDWRATAPDGSHGESRTWHGIGFKDGTPTYFRIYGVDGITPLMQGTVGVTGSGADMEVNDVRTPTSRTQLRRRRRNPGARPNSEIIVKGRAVTVTAFPALQRQSLDVVGVHVPESLRATAVLLRGLALNMELLGPDGQPMDLEYASSTKADDLRAVRVSLASADDIKGWGRELEDPRTWDVEEFWVYRCTRNQCDFVGEVKASKAGLRQPRLIGRQEPEARGTEKQTVEGWIKSVDASREEVTLKDGTKLMIPRKVKANWKALSEGATIRASYVVKGSQKLVTRIRVTRPSTAPCPQCGHTAVPYLRDRREKFSEAGPFGEQLFGDTETERRLKMAYLKLAVPVIHPLFASHLAKICGDDLEDLVAGRKVFLPDTGTVVQADAVEAIGAWVGSPGASVRQLLMSSQPSDGSDDSVGRPAVLGHAVLDVLPVIPPDLRPWRDPAEPSDKVDDPTDFTTDLNQLYEGVFSANARLTAELKRRPAEPRRIVHAMTALQQAVNELLIEGSTDARGRHYRGLGELVGGKEGVLRHALLGKRTDYSGRAVIVPGPDLGLDACGLPARMAQRLLSKKLSKHRGGRRGARLEEPEKLQELFEDRVVLLNRAPSLHRYNVMAFRPRVTDNPVIELCPLVCAGFNADFDGDTIAVHLPVQVASQHEARERCLPSRHLRSIASGRLTLHVAQDIVSGAYLGSQTGTSAAPVPGAFKERLIARLEQQLEEGEGPDAVRAAAEQLMQSGFAEATRGGLTLGLFDIPAVTVADRETMRQEVQPDDWRGWCSLVGKRIERELWEGLRATPPNPMSVMVLTGARGDIPTALQLGGQRLLEQSVRSFAEPVTANFLEGLGPTEFFESAFAARKTMVDKKLVVAEAGDLTRRLVEAGYGLVITEAGPCADDRGIEMRELRPLDPPGEKVPGLRTRLLGRVLMQPVDRIAASGDVLTSDVIERIAAAGVQSVWIRSPITCTASQGLCARCYGWDLSTRTWPELGLPVGLIAGQSIGERGTQLTLRRFHTGGVEAEDITLGLSRVRRLVEGHADLLRLDDLVEDRGVPEAVVLFTRLLHRVYGGAVDDRHFEVVFRAMMVDGKILGVTAAASDPANGLLRTASFRAGLQVLARAALERSTDPLIGYKERLMTGKALRG